MSGGQLTSADRLKVKTAQNLQKNAALIWF
jgi:hypothetical protein